MLRSDDGKRTFPDGSPPLWAIDVCLDARLTLKAGATICLRGQPPMPLYIPGGALG